MNDTETKVPEAEDKAGAFLSMWEHMPGCDFIAAVRFPAWTTKAFLMAALEHAIDNKVEFGLYFGPDGTFIAHSGGAEAHLPSRWSDGSWRIGIEEPCYDDD